MKTLQKLGSCALALLAWTSVGCSKVHDPKTAHATQTGPFGVQEDGPPTTQGSGPQTAQASGPSTAQASGPSTAQETGPALTPASRSRSASERIAEARCHRERECGNVGPDKTYSSSEDCHARIAHDWHDDLNARQCPGGINEQELDECLAQVRAEACENPFDTLARITECTAAQICIEQP